MCCRSRGRTGTWCTGCRIGERRRRKRRSRQSRSCSSQLFYSSCIQDSMQILEILSTALFRAGRTPAIPSNICRSSSPCTQSACPAALHDRADKTRSSRSRRRRRCACCDSAPFPAFLHFPPFLQRGDSPCSPLPSPFDPLQGRYFVCIRNYGRYTADVLYHSHIGHYEDHGKLTTGARGFFGFSPAFFSRRQRLAGFAHRCRRP